MIKEDHLLACTTKMSEILVALPHQPRANPTPAESRLGSARTAQVHLSFRTHILAAIRLFTCQRATARFYAERLVVVRTETCRKRRWRLSLPPSWSRLGEADSIVCPDPVNGVLRENSGLVSERFSPDSADETHRDAKNRPRPRGC